MNRALLWALGIALGIALIFGVKSCRATRSAQASQLRADSIAAALDTTRAVNARAAAILGDSLQGVERRAIQARIERDALDRALGRTSAVISQLTGIIATLRAEVSGTPVETDSGDVRHSEFVVDSTPYHARALVWLPPAPAPGKLDLTVRLDTAQIGVRLQCGERQNGIRPATILVTTPRWLNTSIAGSQVDPSACNPQTIRSRDWSPWWLIPAAFGAGVLYKSR